MAEIPHPGSTWRRGKAHVTVEYTMPGGPGWVVGIRFEDGTETEMPSPEFLKQFRHVSEAEPAAAG